MTNLPDGQVAILIDFENLVRGAHQGDPIDCEVIFRLAEEYGRVLLANAYADWRIKDVNQYQSELYRLGVELVHVFGKGWGTTFKNAVDVRMAVDAIGAVFAYPHIDTFVIVSGDRDFIHVLKALRRSGKAVVGVSPASATSEDFAALCDRFVQYESLATTYESPPASSAASARQEGVGDRSALREVLRIMTLDYPEGIKGARIKPLLRRKLSATFDESNYGFSRLTDLLRSFPEVVRVHAPANGSDVLVLPTSGTLPQALSELDAEKQHDSLARAADLGFYKFERDPRRRRNILERLFIAMSESQPFVWTDIQRSILALEGAENLQLSITSLSRYRTVIFQGRGFVFEPNQDGLAARERRSRLRDDVRTPEDLIRLYERSIVYKLLDAAEKQNPLSPGQITELLGLPADEANLAYCEELLTSAASLPRERPDDGLDE